MHGNDRLKHLIFWNGGSRSFGSFLPKWCTSTNPYCVLNLFLMSKNYDHKCVFEYLFVRLGSKATPCALASVKYITFFLFLLLCFFTWQGNSAFKEKQWQKAINLYTEAIKLNDKVATYYSNRAAAFLELARYDLFPPAIFSPVYLFRELAWGLPFSFEELTCMGVCFAI
jgi:tetratricopeptide (TPR) repeat protein